MSWLALNPIWPDVRQPDGARLAVREGMVAALIAAVLCVLDARDERIFLLPAAIFLILTFAIGRGSLLAATLGFLLCLANLVLGLIFSLEMSSADYARFSRLLWLVNGLLALLFVNAVRGILAQRRSRTATPSGATPSDPPG